MSRHRVPPPTLAQIAYALRLIEIHGFEWSTPAIESVSRAGKDSHGNSPAAIIRRAYQSGSHLFTELDRHEMSKLIEVLQSPATYGITTPRDKLHALRLIEDLGFETSTDAIEAVSRAGGNCLPDSPAALIRSAHRSGKIHMDELSPYEMANFVAVLERPSEHGVNTPT